MIIKICKEDGYEYFECDSVNVGVLEWGNRNLINKDLCKFVLKNGIDRSEAISKTFKKGKMTYTYHEPENQLPYQLKMLEFKKGEKFFVLLTDLHTFLMNDEGKTIDRIN